MDLFSLKQMCSFKVVEMVMNTLSYEPCGLPMFWGMTEYGDEEILQPFLKDKIPQTLIDEVLEITDIDSSLFPYEHPGRDLLLYFQSKRTKKEMEAVFGAGEYLGFSELEWYLFCVEPKEVVDTDTFKKSVDEHIELFENCYFRCPKLKKYWISKFSGELLGKFNHVCKEKKIVRKMRPQKKKLLQHLGL